MMVGIHSPSANDREPSCLRGTYAADIVREHHRGLHWDAERNVRVLDYNRRRETVPGLEGQAWCVMGPSSSLDIVNHDVEY